MNATPKNDAAEEVAPFERVLRHGRGLRGADASNGKWPGYLMLCVASSTGPVWYLAPNSCADVDQNEERVSAVCLDRAIRQWFGGENASNIYKFDPVISPPVEVWRVLSDSRTARRTAGAGRGRGRRRS